MAKLDSLLVLTQGKTHILWDWNGTLMDDVDHIIRVTNVLLAEHRLPKLTIDRYKKIFGFPIRSYYQQLGLDFNKKSFEELSEQFHDLYMESFKESDLVAGMRDAIVGLNQQGMVQSVLSAAEQNILVEMVQHYGLSPYFRHVYGLNDKLAASKIDRGRELLTALEVAPQKVVMIGDTLHDLEVAEALGTEAILVSHGHQCASRLRPKHSAVL